MKLKTGGILAIIAALLLAIYGILATGDSPERTIRKFETAFNVMDVEQLLECIVPETARPIAATINLFGGVIGIDVNDLFVALPFLSSMFDLGEYDNPKISIEVLSVEIRGDIAAVDMDITIRTSSGNATEHVEDAILVRRDGAWYIDVDNGW